MYRGGRVRAATAVAAALVFCCVCVDGGPVRAGDDDDARTIIFSGRDLWSNGAFAYGGLLIAPGGFEQDGLLLKLLLSGGVYRYNAGDLGGQQVIGIESVGQVLPGWRIKRGNLEAKFFFGLDLEQHRLSPDDPGNRLRGTAFGLRVATELWYEPTSETMIAADLSLSTIATSNSARLAFGWHVLDDFLGGFYVGPEVQYFGSDGYRHLRVGAHLTAMKTDAYEWSAASGWARDSDGRAGAYLRLGFMTRR